MDAIAQAFMNMTPASDFKSYSDLGNYMYDTYSDYNWDEVGDWARNCWESARKETGKTEGKDEWGNNYVYTDYSALLLTSNFTGDLTANRTKCTIGVPENIVVTLTQNGTELVKTTVKIDLASLSGENFDISKNSFTASTLVELSNGYKFNVSQVAYTGNQKCSVVYSMS